MDLSIIIVSFNGKEFLRKCLTSLRESLGNKLKHEIIVVDNASTDGSAETISNFKFQISNFKFINNKNNVGFSRANNQGIKVSDKDSKYVLFLNPDTVVENNAIEKMLEFMEKNQDAGASTCKLIMANGEIDDATHRGFPTPWRAFSHFSGLSKIFPRSKLFAGYNLGWMDMEKTHEIDALAGAFMIVRRKAGEEVGWWDEDYFFYGEDIDFCYMLKKKGWKIYYVPSVSITHFKGVSGGIKSVSKKITTASEETKKRATKWRFAAMKIFYKKHYRQKYPWIVNFLVNIGISIKEHI